MTVNIERELNTLSSSTGLIQSCPFCGESPPNRATVNICGHSFCQECLTLSSHRVVVDRDVVAEMAARLQLFWPNIAVATRRTIDWVTLARIDLHTELDAAEAKVKEDFSLIEDCPSCQLKVYRYMSSDLIRMIALNVKDIILQQTKIETWRRWTIRYLRRYEACLATVAQMLREARRDLTLATNALQTMDVTNYRQKLALIFSAHFTTKMFQETAMLETRLRYYEALCEANTHY